MRLFDKNPRSRSGPSRASARARVQAAQTIGSPPRDAADGDERPAANQTAQGAAMPTAAQNAAQVAARNQAARRTSRPLLDPHGIYGTRTAYRLRAAQRRRAMQTVLLFAALIAAGFGLVSWARARRVTHVASRWTSSLMAIPSAPPILVADSSGRNRTARATLLVPTEEGVLLSVDASSGAVRNGFTTAFPLRAQPLAIGDTVFVPGSDGVFSAVDWHSGRVLWNRRSGAAFSARPAYAQLFLSPPPMQTNPTPAVSSPVKPVVNRITNHATSAAATNGAATNGAATNGEARKATVRSVVFAGNDAGEIVAMEAADGRVLWRFNARAPIGAGLTATSDGDMSTHGGRVLAPLLGGSGSSGGVLCLDARSGRALWRKDLGAACLPAPVVGIATPKSQSKTGVRPASGQVFCCTDNGAVLCLDLETGRKQWKIFVSPLRQNAVSEPASNNGATFEAGDTTQNNTAQNETDDAASMVVAQDDDVRNAVIALRGEPLLHVYTWGTCLVLGGNDGGVRCLNARDGKTLWTFDARNAVRSRPAVLLLNGSGNATNGSATNGAAHGATNGDGATNGVSSERATDPSARDLILVGSDGPAVYALDARSGALSWRFATRGTAFSTPFLSGQELIGLTREGFAQSFILPR